MCFNRSLNIKVLPGFLHQNLCQTREHIVLRWFKSCFRFFIVTTRIRLRLKKEETMYIYIFLHANKKEKERNVQMLHKRTNSFPSGPTVQTTLLRSLYNTCTAVHNKHMHSHFCMSGGLQCSLTHNWIFPGCFSNVSPRVSTISDPVGFFYAFVLFLMSDLCITGSGSIF